MKTFEKKYIEIPDGYEAKIEGNKVVFVPKESEDERIRKNILTLVKKHAVSHERCQMEAYLEKQKDEAQKQFNLGIQAGREEAMYEMEKEQKPACVEIDNSNENVVFPFYARVKTSGKAVTIVGGQLSMDGTRWITFSSDSYDHYKVYNPEDLVAEQKPAEWSEEDKRRIVELKTFIAQCNGFNKENRKKAFDMIDALRPQPHWKPSKEQIDALNSIILTGSFTYVGQTQNLISLKDELKKLM